MIMNRIGAVILAAGLSRRMGEPKLILPWGEGQTVISHVVGVLHEAGASPIVVVTGGAHTEILETLYGHPAVCVKNPQFENESMLTTFQVGLAAMPADVSACLVVLGDQPQMELDTVRRLMDVYQEKQPLLVVPSYQMRRGHPWVIARGFWDVIAGLPSSVTMREFLSAHAHQILYFETDSDSILRDVDTREDYAREKPRSFDHGEVPE